MYRSKRIGKGGKPFYLLKFRTFKKGFDGGLPTASMNDPRLSKIGKWLRRFKIDELPTIINLFKGDIAICGARPDTPNEIETLDEETKKLIYKYRPGIISPATLWNIKEDETLSAQKNPHEYYTKVIKPVKYFLNCHYLKNKTLWYDIKIIMAYICKHIGVHPKYFKIYPKGFYGL